MEILSINFAIFVVQLAFCIVPITLGIRLFTISSDFKNEIRQKISKKLLGDPTLIEPGFYKFVLNSIASFSIIIGLAFAFFIIFVVLPK